MHNLLNIINLLVQHKIFTLLCFAHLPTQLGADIGGMRNTHQQRLINIQPYHLIFNIYCLASLLFAASKQCRDQ